jgi:hypothetical protein
MGLLLNVAVIAAVVIVIAVAVFLIFPATAVSTKLTPLRAESLVVNDIKTQNPNANVTVISVSNSTLEPGKSWQVVASVIYNGSKPCPIVMIDVFDYPALGLQNYTANLYTRGCVINGLTSAPSYVISLPQIAIARSYSLNDTAIMDYVSKFGYGNTFVSASFKGQTQTNSIFGNESNVWLVRYKATNANYSLNAVLNQSGMITQTYNAS